MWDTNTLTERLQKFGVGRRGIHDELFGNDKAPARLGMYDEEDFCDQMYERLNCACTVPAHGCGQCRRALPSSHLLHLHLQETHDSFFAVMAAKKPSYCCYIKECTTKFMNSEERLDHCIQVHKLPKDFRFEIKPMNTDKSKKKTQKVISSASMDVDVDDTQGSTEPQKFFFHNNNKKSFIRYSGKKFTSDKPKKLLTPINMDEIMSDLKENLPK